MQGHDEGVARWIQRRSFCCKKPTGGEISKELTAFALWRAWNYAWRYGRGRDFALGRSVEDIVQEVIYKALSEERQWDPERGELVPWLKDQVKSIVDALARSAAHRYETASVERMVEEGTFDKVEYQPVQAGVLVVPKAADPKEIVAQREYVEQRMSDLYNAMDGDPELEDVLLAMLDGCEAKPQSLATTLGVSVTTINNRLKRIRRRARQLKGDS